MEDFDPIGEEQTLFKKLKGFFKNKFSKKHIFVEIHSPSKDMVEEVSKQLLLFNNEIMSPNEIREAVLYADGEPIIRKEK